MSRKIVLTAVAVVAAFVAALLGWQAWSGSQAPQTATTAPVQRATVTQTVLATGMLEANQLVSVGARVSGQIDTLAVSLGQIVKAGDLIAQIDNQDQQNDVLQAEASLASIAAQIAAKQADLEKAQLSLSRYSRLNLQNYSSQETVESAQADVKIAEADLDALKAEKSSAEISVSNSRLALDRTKIVAPIDGTVVAVVVKQGQTVNALQSAPTIVKLAQLDTMLVKVEISEADVVNVKVGQQASFTILGEPATTFRAVVREIEPAPSEISDSDTISSDEAIYYNGLLEVANPEGKLRIGMTAQVSIELGRAENVLTVPFAAVRDQSTAPKVQVYDPATRTSREQQVETGLTDKVTVEIRSGLTEGQQVVTGSAQTTTSTSGGNRMGPPMGF